VGRLASASVARGESNDPRLRVLGVGMGALDRRGAFSWVLSAPRRLDQVVL